MDNQLLGNLSLNEISRRNGGRFQSSDSRVYDFTNSGDTKTYNTPGKYNGGGFAD